MSEEQSLFVGLNLDVGSLKPGFLTVTDACRVPSEQELAGRDRSLDDPSLPAGGWVMSPILRCPVAPSEMDYYCRKGVFLRLAAPWVELPTEALLLPMAFVGVKPCEMMTA